MRAATLPNALHADARAQLCMHAEEKEKKRASLLCVYILHGGRYSEKVACNSRCLFLYGPALQDYIRRLAKSGRLRIVTRCVCASIFVCSGTAVVRYGSVIRKRGC